MSADHAVRRRSGRVRLSRYAARDAKAPGSGTDTGLTRVLCRLVQSQRPSRLTASCFVFSPDLREVLLTHHKKGGFWVQLGGHLEADDASLGDAARREAREESGIGDLQLGSDRVMDLERHELHGGFTCAAHWDVGFVAVASPTAAVDVSAESLDVRWFPVGALPDAVPPGFALRLATVRARATGEERRAG